MLYHRLLATLSMVALTSCASLVRNECVNTNWHSRGVNDAMSGKIANINSSFGASCETVGVLPNDREYQRGYQEGLLSYCKANIATESGLSGTNYDAELCPEEIRLQLENAYLSSVVTRKTVDPHDQTRRQIEIRSALQDLESQIKLSNLNQFQQADMMKNIERLRKLMAVEQQNSL